MLCCEGNRTDVQSLVALPRKRRSWRAAKAGLVTLVVAAAAPGAELSFSEALELLARRNEGLAAARAEVRQREAEVQAARGLAWPRLEASARHTRIDDPVVIDLDPVRQVMLQLHPNVPPAAVPPFTLQVQDDTFWRADVRASWPLYTGGKIKAARDAAGAELRSSEAAARLTGEGLTTELARRYFAVRLALRARVVRSQVVAALDLHVAHARRLEEEGMLARAETLHAEVARAEAARQLAKAERDVELARLAVASILSVDDPDLTLSTPLFVVSQIEPVGEVVARAVAANPNLTRLKAMRELAAVGRQAEQARYVPDLYLFGLHELHPSDLTLLEPAWAVGVGASVTLFDGFTREHRIVAARDREQRVELLEQRARRDIATLVEKRYREMVTARELFSTLAETAKLVDENVRVRTRAFQEGMGTSLDVVDAQLARSRVELERAAAGYDFVVALAELLEASGQSARLPELIARADVEVER